MTDNNYTLSPETKMSDADAVSYIKRQARVVSAHFRKGESVTDRAAYATFVADGLGYFDRKSPNYVTRDEYAALFGLRSKSIVGGWLTLGRALMTVGLDPEGDTYARLRNSGAYGRKEVREAIEADGATEESVREALDRFVNPDGTRKSGKRAAQPNEGGEQSEETPTPTEESVADAAKSALKTLDAALKMLGKSGVEGDDEVRREIVDRLSTIVTREERFNAKADAKADAAA